MKIQTSSTAKLLNSSPLRHGLFLVALVLAAQAGIAAEGGSPIVRRPIGISAQGTTWQTLSNFGRAGSDDSSAPMAVPVSTVDTDLYTGYENAIYAADDNTVF